MFVTGAAVQWLRDGLGIISRPSETEAMAASLDSNDGVYFVPALTGLGSPHWDPYARGTIVGSRAAPGGSTSRAPRSRRSPTRPWTRSRRWRRPPASASRAARRRRRGRERLADAVPGRRARAARWWCRRCPRPRRSAPPTWPASGPGCGRRATCRSLWREAARYEPRMGDDERESLLAGWRRALERAGWARLTASCNRL